MIKNLQSFNKILFISIALVALVGFVKGILPHLEILNISVQVGALIGIISYVTATMNAATKARIEEEIKYRESISTELNTLKFDLKHIVDNLQDQVGNNRVAIESHTSNYGHNGSIEELFKLREDVSRMRAEQAIKGDMIDLQDTMDALKAQFESMQLACENVQLESDD